jgi:hypothetical protein
MQLAGMSAEDMRTRMQTCFMTGQHQSVSLHTSVDGEQPMMLYYLPVIAVAKSIWEDPSHADVMHMAPEVVLNGAGERILFDFNGGDSHKRIIVLNG